MHKTMNVTLFLLMILGAGMAGAVSQQAFTTFHSGEPMATTVNAADTILILQGGVIKQAPISLARGTTVTTSAPLVTGNCVQATGAATIATASGPCVVPGPAPLLLAQ